MSARVKPVVHELDPEGIVDVRLGLIVVQQAPVFPQRTFGDGQEAPGVPLNGVGGRCDKALVGCHRLELACWSASTTCTG